MTLKSINSRLRAIEQARGTRAVTLEYPDGSTQSFHLAWQTDELEILFAGIDIARAANADAPPPKDTRFTHIARQVAKSAGSSDEGLYGTVREIVRGAEDPARKCNGHAPHAGSS